MNPFYPKFGAAEDAPDYRISESSDNCESCAHYRNLGNQGYCEKFSFVCEPEYVCDDFRPAGVIKESGLDLRALAGLEGIDAEEIAQELKNRETAAMVAAKNLADLKPAAAASAANRAKLVPTRYRGTVKALEMAYPLEKYTEEKSASSDTSAFFEGLHPIPGGVVTQAVSDRLDPGTTAEDMRRRKRLAILGGAATGGVLLPGAIAATIGGARGVSLRKGLSRLSGAGAGARAALDDTFHRASIPALATGAALGGLGAGEQYEIGSALGSLVQEKNAAYGAFGATGAALMGGKSLLSDKDKILRDLTLARTGKISRGELSNRLQNYGIAAGANAAVGGALGMGAVLGFRKIMKPELTRMGDSLAAYAGQKAEAASQKTLASVDDLLTKHRTAAATEAAELADRQRKAYSQTITDKGEELVDRMRNADLLEGTRKGMSGASPIPIEHRIKNPFKSVGTRLRGMFSRKDKYARLNEQLAAEEAAQAAMKA